MDFFATDIQNIRGIGAVKAKAFAKLGIRTYRDLLTHFPRAYIDHRHTVAIADIIDHIDEYVTLIAVVGSVPAPHRIRKGLTICRLHIYDETGRMQITFFNNPYLKNMLRAGETYAFYGKISPMGTTLTMTSPTFEPYRADRPPTLRPVYPLSSGLTQKSIAAAVGEILPLIPSDHDPLPEYLRQRLGLMPYAEALRAVHRPQDDEALSRARYRLNFEELFYYLLGLSLLKKRARKPNRYPARNSDGSFVKLHNFTLTNAQKKVISEIRNDLAAPHTMNRLLQGDVGSGKTLVAGDAAWQVLRAEHQVAIMAPTEILAAQHFDYFAPLFEKLGKKTVLLVSSLSAAEKRAAKAAIQSGEADIVVGTHALIQKGVDFKDLALVVTDEQHRFGVLQRGALTDKGAAPHVLAMSATPIPRTMALILYGEMDISVLDELPPGRQKIETYLVTSDYEERLYAFIEKQINASHRVYWVCPLVEQDEESELTSVEAQADTLKSRFGDAVAVIHGKMSAKEKDAVMTSFARGEISVLVATTVIEVGINVPAATLMIIKDADRFGLSQLHQLRGRVGRGGDRSYCVLISDSRSDSAKKRMRFFTSTTDGFKIAAEDLATRGPGDLIGARQSGEDAAHLIAQRCDMRQVELAQRAAGYVLEKDPSLSRPEHRALLSIVMEKFEQSGDIFS